MRKAGRGRAKEDMGKFDDDDDGDGNEVGLEGCFQPTWSRQGISSPQFGTDKASGA